MNIRIVKCNKPQSWYVERVGQKFAVLETDEVNEHYIVHKGRIVNSYVDFEDAEIVKNTTDE